MRAPGLVSIVWVASACSGEGLPSPSQITALRVLALVTETPEVAPGTAVQVRAAWVDPVQGREFRARWQLCAERDVADPRACPASERAVDLGEGSSVTTPLLPRVGTYFVLVAACADVAPRFQRSLGHWRCDDGTWAEEVFRRIRVTESATRNRPPGIARWRFAYGDASVLVPPGEDASVTLPDCEGRRCGAWTIQVLPTEGSAEVLADGGRESLSVSFYVTSGFTDQPRDTGQPGEEREFTARWTPTRNVSSVWVVLRDQRGGESVRGAQVTDSGR